MPSVIVRPEAEHQVYPLTFHVRLPARASADLAQQRLQWSLERMIGRLHTQGWTFVRLSHRPPRGPLPVVPVKGFPRRPPGGNARTPLGPHDDALSRVTTFEAHLLTDEVDWEYCALFERPAIATAYEAPEKGAPQPPWLKH